MIITGLSVSVVNNNTVLYVIDEEKVCYNWNVY